jgi:hypothetical protein
VPGGQGSAGTINIQLGLAREPPNGPREWNGPREASCFVFVLCSVIFFFSFRVLFVFG